MKTYPIKPDRINGPGSDGLFRLRHGGPLSQLIVSVFQPATFSERGGKRLNSGGVLGGPNICEVDA